MSVLVVKIHSPLNLDINVKAVLAYVPGKALDYYLAGQIPQDTPGVEWAVCKNGQAVTVPYLTVPIVDGDKIAICPKQGATVAGAVASLVAESLFLVGTTAFTVAFEVAYFASLVVVGYGMAALASALGPKPPKANDARGEKRYGWGPLVQTQNEGVEIPLIFGTNKVAGHTINQFLKINPSDGNKETLYILNAVCDHEVDEITDVEISGQPHDYYKDCAVSTRLGTLNDTLIDGFGELTTQTEVNRGVSKGSPVIAQTQGACQKIEVVLSAPRGMFRMRKSGKLANVTVQYSIHYRAFGGSSWTEHVSSQAWTEKSQSATKKVVTIDALPLDTYEIRVTRESDDTNSPRIMDEIKFAFIQEILTEGLTYPGLAKYAVAVLATDQLSGGMPTLNCIVKRNSVQVYDVDAGAWVTRSATNPAWICYTLLIFHGIPLGRIVWQDFKDWADFCDQDICDGEKRISVNVVLSGGSAWDQLQKVANMGRASVIRRNTKYGVFVDKEDGLVSHLFTMGNIIEGTFAIQYLPKKDRAEAVEIEYTDIDRDHTRQVVTVFSDSYISEDKDKTKSKATVSIEAAITQAQAVREGIFRINSNKYLVRIVSFDAYIDAFAAVVGDVFEFAHESVNYRATDIGGVIVAAGNDDGSGAPYVTLDRPVSLSSTDVYKIKVRLGDDTTVEKTVDNTKINDWSIDHVTLPLTQPWANVPTNNDIYAFGRADTYLKRYRIISADRKDDQTRTIVGLEYVEQIYTDNDDVIIEEPEWKITYPEALQVEVNEILVYAQDGGYASNLNLAWHRGRSAKPVSWAI